MRPSSILNDSEVPLVHSLVRLLLVGVMHIVCGADRVVSVTSLASRTVKASSLGLEGSVAISFNCRRKHVVLSSVVLGGFLSFVLLNLSCTENDLEDYG